MDGQSTEDRILEAAAALWRDGGFEAVTTRAVAARAGVNEVTLFRHFANKEGLLKAMVERAVQARAPAEEAPSGSSPDLEADLYHWARAYLDQTLPVGDVILLGLVEACGRPDLAKACLAAPSTLRAELTDHLAGRAAAGHLPRGPFAEVAEAFYATLFAHAITARLRHGEPDAETVARRAATVFARALEPRQPAEPRPISPPAGGAVIGH